MTRRPIRNGMTPHLAALGLLWTLLSLSSGNLYAQSVYRIVGPNGQVTFSDQPPPTTADKTSTLNVGASGPAASGPALPFDLQQVVRKYPVTLYTGVKCGPCGSGRALLSSRGVPFTEHTITSAQDADALQRLSGDNSLPLLTIGGQQLKGFSDTEWTQYLNAAGYPKTSELPSGYQNPPATPLVAEHKPAVPVAKRAGQQLANTAEPGQAPGRNTQDNPAGIRF